MSLLSAKPARAPWLHWAKGALNVAARVFGVVVGGYALAASLVALGAVALPLWTGMARGEAVLLFSMLGFLIYLAAIIWGFAERRVWLVWLVLFGGAACAYGLTKVLATSLLALHGGAT